MKDFDLRLLGEVKNLRGQRVLLRVDLNIPLDYQGRFNPGSHRRLLYILPTLAYLKNKGAKIIMVSHLGRPQGETPALSLELIAKKLGQVINQKIYFIHDSLTESKVVDRKLEDLQNGQFALLENIRFYKGEDENNPFLARRLAGLADIFVNDAFGVVHRTTASTFGVAKLLPSYAGFLLAKEVKTLSALLIQPKTPFVAVFGGAKISEKLPMIKKITEQADLVLLGGGLAISLLKAAGSKIGQSLYCRDDLAAAKVLLKYKNMILPLDLVVSKNNHHPQAMRVVAPVGVAPDEIIVDIGPETTARFAKFLSTAKTVLWNGPMGILEVPEFSHGSLAVTRSIAERMTTKKCFSVVGGGETIELLESLQMADQVDHISTGGGAMLAFLSGQKLPALEILRKSASGSK